MKSTEHFIITLVAYVIIIFHYIYNYEIITHPYMFLLIIGLFAVGGWNFGVGVGKFIQEIKK